MSSYFYSQAEKNVQNAIIFEQLKTYAEKQKVLIYLLNRPLTDQKYTYDYTDGLIVLSPGKQIAIVDCGAQQNNFENYVEDVIEDVGSISDKYLYKDVIGRPRNWRNTLVNINTSVHDILDINHFFSFLNLTDDLDKKKIDLLISLFIGSINDIDRVKVDLPQALLDKVKQKIQLFDGDQTRFIYEKLQQKEIRIQGLSGTGKTELLLHKIKELYTVDSESRIFFTCHNKILADTLKDRIPAFFNFMKVEQQIEWNQRLWCENAWGSGKDINSGAYRYICAYYQIPFNTYSFHMPFSKACELAYAEILEKQKKDDFDYAFTYMFIDESQDFDDNFFKLCNLVTEKNIYIAGDIFQSIFDENISQTIEPDYLLGKCYRTDPKTLMFAHALGMGLFEKNKLRWLEQKEWKDCGYNVDVKDNKYHLSREPLRRFEDLDENFQSIKISEIDDSFKDSVIQILKEIVEENPTVKPDDIGIILLDRDKNIYDFADLLEIHINAVFHWKVNKAYQTKERQLNTILISNRNNVKGLEFPFVICVTKGISENPTYRNALYTMLTRSFIRSYLLVPKNKLSGLTDQMMAGLDEIVTTNQMIIQEPTDEEKKKIRTRFKYNLKKLSHYDLVMEILKGLKVDKKLHNKILGMTQQMDLMDSDEDTIRSFIVDTLKYVKLKP